MKIIPTIFEQSFEEIEKRIKWIDSVSDIVEIDIADGKLVDGVTYQDLQTLSSIDTPIYYGVHLMVLEPQDYLKVRIEKVSKISAQIETKGNIPFFIKRARELGYEVGLSINPETSTSEVEPYLKEIDFVQFMTVKPGGKGRELDLGVLEKVKNFKGSHPDMEIQLDGGIKEDHLPKLLNIGVDNVVINTAIFGTGDPKGTLLRLKEKYEMQKSDPNKSSEITSLSAVKDDRKIKKVAFLGGADWKEGDEIYTAAYDTAKVLAENGYEIVNGGGPGVMRASTKGGHAGGGKVLAVTYHPNKPKKYFEGVDPENDFDEEVYTLDYFDRTKVMLQNSDLHIIFKGATGTISEFGMTWASSRIHQGNHKPIVLYGDFWNVIIKCFEETMILRPGETDLLKICTTPEEVLEYTKSLG